MNLFVTRVSTMLWNDEINKNTKTIIHKVGHETFLAMTVEHKSSVRKNKNRLEALEVNYRKSVGDLKTECWTNQEVRGLAQAKSAMTL